MYPFSPYAWLVLTIFSIFPFCSPAQQELPPEPKWPTTPDKDWLLHPESFEAEVYRGSQSNTIVLANGLIKRTFLLSPNAATIGLENLVTGQNLLRGVKPEAELSINGRNQTLGGLIGQSNYAFLRAEDIPQLRKDSSEWKYMGYEVGETEAPFAWRRVRHHSSYSNWPPKGVSLHLHFQLPVDKEVSPEKNPHIKATVHYELYDGIPVYAKWLTVENHTDSTLQIDDFTSEILAAVEYGSAVETREYGVSSPNIHVETDYAFASFNVEDANHHAVHWEADPEYDTQVNYLKLTPCLLRVSPELGPSQLVAPGDSFSSFRTFVLPYDSYDRERQGLSLRRMYRTLAPWTTENPLMMHARFADWERVKIAIDQCAAVGFEMVILTFGSGFNIEDTSQTYVEEMKKYAAYAQEKGVEIGGYSLLASRSIGEGQDVVMPEGEKPTFGNSPCIGSEWGEAYFEKLYAFYEQTGFSLLEHDGSYPGDVCISDQHPGHRGYEDSRWNQYQVISKFYKWCRSQGVYLNVPDYYYMTGSNKCGMGYREVNWSLPRSQQVLHTRQNIYDGSWTKTPSMGWMFVPLTEYHGGGAAATIEPLKEHLPHYEQMMASNLGGGVQACYRGPRLFDGPETQAMVSKQVNWFKKHREVLEGDIIHLRRADGQDLDYWLNVNPQGEEKGLLMVFNPLEEPIEKTIQVPLYYTNLMDQAEISQEDGPTETYTLSRDYKISLPVAVPGKGYTWFVIK